MTLEVRMSQQSGRVFKRCRCQIESGGVCPRLVENGHGSWFLSLELLPAGDGRRRRLRVGGYASEAQAWAALAAVRPAGGAPASAGWTTGGWLSYWASTRQSLRAATLRSYAGRLRLYLLPGLEKIPLATLTASDVRALFTRVITDHELAGRPMSTTSLMRLHATLRTALNAAIREGIITANPARWVELPQQRRPHPVVWTRSRVLAWQQTGERPAVAVWTVTQTATFLQATADDPLFPLFHLVALRGLRRGEAVGLRWSEVDLETQSLTVCQLQETDGALRISPPKSAASNREIALDAGTTDVLRRLREAQAASGVPEGWVFCKPDGSPLSPSWVTHRFHTLVLASGLPPVRLHDSRHGAATLALAAGADLKTIQDMLGHASIVLTADTYTSVLPDVARQAADGIAQLILQAGRTKPVARPVARPHAAPPRPHRRAPRPAAKAKSAANIGAPSGT